MIQAEGSVKVAFSYRARRYLETRRKKRKRSHNNMRKIPEKARSVDSIVTSGSKTRGKT